MDMEQLTELAAPTADHDPLLGLRALARLRAETERSEAVPVRRARDNGATWLRTAAGLGVPKQAFHKRYAGRGRFGGRS